MDEDMVMMMDIEDIITWMIAHRTDQKAMDEINSVSFPFTTKYKSFSDPNKGQKQKQKRVIKDDPF